MKIQVKVILENDDIPETKRQSVSIETHGRRGDTFVVMKNKDIIEGSMEDVYDVPVGGRLVITTPNIEREMVMDEDQNAVVRKDAQVQDENRADKPVVTPPPPQHTLPPLNPSPQNLTSTPPNPASTANTVRPTTAPLEAKKSTDETLDTRNLKK